MGVHVMQGGGTIDRKAFVSVARSVFESEIPRVFTAHSAPGRDLKRFDAPAQMDEHLLLECATGSNFVDFAIHYPETQGHVELERITVGPRRCDGETFRYAVRGWGVIHLQCDFRKPPALRCHVTVNTERRANSWKDTYPSLDDPKLWDWKLVEKHARRLIRVIKKHAQPGAAGDTQVAAHS